MKYFNSDRRNFMGRIESFLIDRKMGEKRKLTKIKQKHNIPSVFDRAEIDPSQDELIQYNKNNNALVETAMLPKIFSPVVKLTGHKGPAHSCRFSPDGKLLATAGFDRNLFLWDIFSDNCENICSKQIHSHSIQQLQWLDKTSVVSVSVDKTARLFDVASETVIIKWSEHSKIVNSIAKDSTNEKVFLTGSDDRTSLLFDIRQKNSVLKFQNIFEILSVELKGDQIYTAGLDSFIRCFDKRKPLEPIYKIDSGKDFITSINIEKNFLVSYNLYGEINIYDISVYMKEKGERLLKKINLSFNNSNNNKNFHEKNLLKIKLNKNLIGVGRIDNYNGIVLNYTSNQIKSETLQHKGAVFEIDFHPKDNNLIATASADSLCYLIQS